MWNEPRKERLALISRLYETESIPIKDKIIHLHFFLGGCDWYITNAEWGYISFSELRAITINGIEVDCELEVHWQR